MTTANDAGRAAATANPGAPSTNGSATLRDRVRSLQLSERGAGGKSTRSRPWRCRGASA